ncbi:ubiquitin-conjugating enzyme E2 Z-like [Amblyomma americanum]
MSRVQRAAGGNGSQTSSQDPTKLGNEAPSPMCLLRLKQELANMKAKPMQGVFISSDDNDASTIHALMIGPPDTPYEGGFFHFVIKCTRDYATKPPRVHLSTPGAEGVQLNADINDAGLVWLKMLGTFRGDSWNCSYTVSTVLLAIQGVINKDCGIENAKREHAVARHRDYVEHETIRVVVCDAVEDCFKDESKYPTSFKHVVLEKFLEFHSKYEDLVKNRLPANGYEMKSYLGAIMGTYEYQRLLARLQELRKQVEESIQVVTATVTNDLVEAAD